MSQNTKTEAVQAPVAASRRRLDALFNPRSIAVVGASTKPEAVGHAVLRNLLYGGYQGVLYPVNPKAHSICGVKCYPSIEAIGDPVDLVVIIVPAKVVPNVIAECGRCNIPAAIVISAGFKEVGQAGKKLEDKLVQVARENNVSVLGPNCLGLINTDPKVSANASFAAAMPARGRIALMSQSGALCTAILDYANGRDIGFSKFVSFGNKADIDEVDLLAALGQDPETDVILMYLEDLSNGQEFVELAHEITHGANAKPILAIKTGRTVQGAAAAASHTGSLAGSDEVFDAIFEQGGVLRVESIEDLFNFATIFMDRRRPGGNRVGIVTNAGGPGIMTTDACIRNGLQMAKFQEYTLKSLKFQLPPAASFKNPVDVIGDARHDRYRAALDAVCSDDATDAIIVLITPQNMTNVSEIADVIVETRNFVSKPIVACFMGAVDVAPRCRNPAETGRAQFPIPRRRRPIARRPLPVRQVGQHADRPGQGVRGRSPDRPAYHRPGAGRRPVPDRRAARP